MRNTKPLTGQRFGRLTVTGKAVRANKRQSHWCCTCDCGKEITTRRDNLTAGLTTSCGCYSRERSTTHGMRDSIVYRKWVAMRSRCSNPKDSSYSNYGGRGIKVCERWDKFENFFEDMGHPPTPKHQPDRIDNDGDYEPGNLRWVTPRQNANNRRDSAFVEFDGRTKTMRNWAREFGIGYSTFQYRLKAGWSMERISSTAVDTAKGWRKKP